jgi:hypothetical protein
MTKGKKTGHLIQGTNEKWQKLDQSYISWMYRYIEPYANLDRQHVCIIIEQINLNKNGDYITLTSID